MRPWDDWAVIPAWLHPAGHLASRQELQEQLSVFEPYGFHQSFVDNCQEVLIRVSDYAEKEWATRRPLSSAIPVFYDGTYYFTRLGDVFKPDVWLHVFLWKNRFISQVCGNFTRNHPPDAEAGPDQAVEQASRGGTVVTVDGSASSDPDGDALTYEWMEGNRVISGPSDRPQCQVLLPLGPHTLTLVVDDGWDATDTDTVSVTVRDTTPPEITVPDDITVEQETRNGTKVYFPISATDVCDANPTVIADPPSGTVFPLGTTPVKVTATDASGNTAGPLSFNVIVRDTTPPEITVPDDITVEQKTSDGTKVYFTVSATDICDANPTVVAAPPSGTEFPLGTTQVRVTATDASGNKSEPKWFKVTVEDTTPPDVDLSAAKTTLWPPNHDLVDIGLRLFVADICDQNPTVAVSVTQDEPVEDQTGDGHFAPDAKLLLNSNGKVTGLRLRAERKGDGDGRVYLIIVTVTDHSGNITTKMLAVTVSHSQSKQDQQAVAVQAAAALAAGVPLPYDSIAGAAIGPKQ